MSYVNTGRWIVGQLRQVSIDIHGTRTPTGDVKPNDPSDPDYVTPFENGDSEAACPLSHFTVNWILAEQVTPLPYVDCDINVVSDITGDIVREGVNGSGTATGDAGQNITFIASSANVSVGTNPFIKLVIKRNGTEIYNHVTPQFVGAILSYSEIGQKDAVYDVTASSYSDEGTTTTTSSTTTTTTEGP